MSYKRKFNRRYSSRRKIRRMSKAIRNNRKLFSSRGGFRF